MKSAFDKNRTLLMLIVQIIILLSTAHTVVSEYLNGEAVNGIEYFTTDSNILAGVFALFAVFFAVRSLLRKEDTVPYWAAVFQYVSASCLFLTFVTVVVFVAPVDVICGKQYIEMFSNDLFIMHLTNPILAVLSFIFLQGQYRIKREECKWVMLAVIVYAAVYFLMVIVFRKWSDFYDFSFGGKYYLIPLVVAVMLLLTYFLARLLMWLNIKAQEKRAGSKVSE